jgi:hypothetical protein
MTTASPDRPPTSTALAMPGIPEHWLLRGVRRALGFLRLQGSWPVKPEAPTVDAKDHGSDMKLTPGLMTEIARKLSDAGAWDECPRCHSPKHRPNIPWDPTTGQSALASASIPALPPFRLMGGFVLLPVQDQTSVPDINAPFLPCAAAVCETCGFVSLHSLGAIGIDYRT